MTAPSLRRLLHAASGATLLVVPVFSWQFLRAVLLGAAALAVAGEAIRLGFPGVQAWLTRRLPVFREREAARPSGAMWLAVGYAAASLTPFPAPAAGILVGALADPAAAWVGLREGVTGRKTIRGSGAHLIVALAVLYGMGVGWIAAVAASVIATALERWPLGLDDNVLVAPATALTVALLN